MDAYEQISPKRIRKVLILVVIGFFLAIGLGILLFILFVENWQFYFNELISVAQEYIGINPGMAYFLGSGLYSLNAASPFFADIFGAIGPEVQIFIQNATLPAILTWFITGFVLGFFAKRWDDGFFSGLLCGIAVWIFMIVASRIAILGNSQLGVLELGYIIIVFMLLVNSFAAFLICVCGGVLGGLLYSKVLFRRQALIEQYT
ncbi:MAG TPA: hypothetical protein VMV49_15025 [Candidatus Deferrimicrobium sp.]|nr:hypothetical protein [Candidatus Deferrimicrobium sp.]